MNSQPFKITAFVSGGHEAAPRLLVGMERAAAAFPDVKLSAVLIPKDIGGAMPPLPESDGAVLCVSPGVAWAQHVADRYERLVSCGNGWARPGVPVANTDSSGVWEDAAVYYSSLNLPSVALLIAKRRPEKEFILIDEGLRKRCGILKMGYSSYFHYDENPCDWEQRFQADQRVIEFIRNLPRPCGIIATDDHLASEVIAIAARLGIPVPDSLSVIGRGDYMRCVQTVPTISTYPVPVEELGMHGFRLMYGWLKTGVKPESQILVVRPSLIPRQSTAVRVKLGWCMGHALEVIERKHGIGVSVKELADELRMPTRQFIELYRSRYGLRPSDAIRKAKISRMAYLIQSTRMTIAEMAGECGFDDPAGFCKFFKRETGMTPSEYRKGSQKKLA